MAGALRSLMCPCSTLSYKGGQPVTGDNSTEDYIRFWEQFIFRTDILPSTKYSQSLPFKQGFLFCSTSIKLLALYYKVSLPPSYPFPTPLHYLYETYYCYTPSPQPPTFLSLASLVSSPSKYLLFPSSLL